MEVNENNDKKLNFLNKEELVSALEESNYYVSIAARKLGVNRSSVYKYMAIYGIPKSGVYGVPMTHKYNNKFVQNTYYKMISRCYNEKNPDFKYYGARGISVCDEWRNSRDCFTEFVMALDHFGEDGYSLDRIDNNGNYCPQNLRLASKSEQMSNNRRNHIVTYEGEDYTLTQFAKKFGLKPDFVKDRLRLGFTPEEVITVPLWSKRRFYDKNKSTPS